MLLFIVARGGLSLAVVAWSISQWVGILTSATVENCSAQVVVCGKGVAIAAATAFSEPWAYQVLPPVDVAEAMWVFEPRDQDLETFACTHPIPGVNYLTDSSVVIISIRHWFIIAAFALFYVAIRFIYRQCPQTQPCEV